MLADCFRFFEIFSDAFKNTVRNLQDSFKFFSSTQIISDPYRFFQNPADFSKFNQILPVFLVSPSDCFQFFWVSQFLSDFLRVLQILWNSFRFFSNLPISFFSDAFRFFHSLSDSLFKIHSIFFIPDAFRYFQIVSDFFEFFQMLSKTQSGILKILSNFSDLYRSLQILQNSFKFFQFF